MSTALFAWKRAAVFLLVGLAGLLLTCALEAFTSLDLMVQDLFYRAENGTWLADARSPGPRFVFYTFPKILLICGGCLVLGGLFNFCKILPLRLSRPEAMFVLLCLISIPLLVSALKGITRIHCPSELQRYGGSEQYRKFTSLAPATPQKVRPHCFPAGHASGGFALVSLYFLKTNWRWFLVFFGYGWTMGLYQMLKGAHFLSHTLATMFLAFFICGALALIFARVNPPR